jgi:hypothetical protein
MGEKGEEGGEGAISRLVLDEEGVQGEEERVSLISSLLGVPVRGLGFSIL